MQHLYASRVRIERPGLGNDGGVATMTWTTVEGGEFVPCRLDLNFLRPGKDIAPAMEAGKAPDRIGIMFCDADTPLRAGDRVVTVPDEYDQEPVKGTFEIRVIPDVVVGYSAAHHLEIQILETNQALDGLWPGDADMDDLMDEEMP